MFWQACEEFQKIPVTSSEKVWYRCLPWLSGRLLNLCLHLIVPALITFIGDILAMLIEAGELKLIQLTYTNNVYRFIVSNHEHLYLGVATSMRPYLLRNVYTLITL